MNSGGNGAKIREIDGVQAWDDLVRESAKSEQIIVIDVYKDWCGPCTCMHFFFDRLQIEGVQIEDRVLFRTVSLRLLHYPHRHLFTFVYSSGKPRDRGRQY